MGYHTEFHGGLLVVIENTEINKNRIKPFKTIVKEGCKFEDDLPWKLTSNLRWNLSNDEDDNEVRYGEQFMIYNLVSSRKDKPYQCKEYLQQILELFKSWGWVAKGNIFWHGEDHMDAGIFRVINNKLTVIDSANYQEPDEIMVKPATSD